MKLRKIEFEMPILFIPETNLKSLKEIKNFWNGTKLKTKNEKTKTNN